MSKPHKSSSSGAAATGGLARKDSSASQSKKSPVDPMTITPDVVWKHRDGNRDQHSAAAAAASGSGYESADGYTPQGQIAAAAPGGSSAKKSSPKTKPTSSPTSAKDTAAAKTAAASANAAHAAANLKTSSTLLAEEVAALKEENAQLRDIEKQFWVLLDERELLQDEVRGLRLGIPGAAGASSRTGSSAFAIGGDSQALLAQSGKQPLVRAPAEADEAHKNYAQMGAALDEALTMLLELDKQAATRANGSASSVVAPGTLIHRFLDFCSAERSGVHHRSALPSVAPTQQSAGGGHRDPSDSVTSNFHSRTAALMANLNQTPTNAAAASPGSRSQSTANQQQPHIDNMSATITSSSLSQALRLAQDEIHHLKMELDRSDLSRLQALDDVDKMQKQIQVLSQSVVELRSAYASARAQADANAKSAETVHEVTVRLAERDAEASHLKARIAEMQRLAASGGSALAADASRIRTEMNARLGKSQ